MSSSILDCSGLACPQPVILTKKTVETEAPQHLTVVVDNEPALENVSRFLASQGYTTSSEKDGQSWRIEAQATGQSGSAAKSSASEPSAPRTGEDAKTAVLILSPVMGTGDDELGTRLMKNFLATLPEMGESLWRVIMLNGAVSLATQDSHVIEELRILEASGVRILVCGTCLEHFGLLATKAVGETTNMLDVVTSLQLADKVIRI